MNDRIRLKFATWDYDHVRDFRSGAVRAEGIEVSPWLIMDFHEIFARFLANREWDVTEMSFAKFVAEATRPDAEIIGLPVFLRRAFRFGYIFVNRTRIREPKDLRGKRIGIPEWAQTATVYMRGWLQDDVGIPLTEIDWVQAGTDEAGRAELVEMDLPEGVRLTRVTDKTLSEMLDAGELDCAMAATPPKAFGRNPDVVRLFPDTRPIDESYYAARGVYPIMHIVAMRKALLQDDPWIARNLYNAFEESKQRCLDRIRRGLDYPVPWLADHAALAARTFGKDFFPYGIEENRPTLELFLRYAYEQGIVPRPIEPEELFPKGIMIAARI